MLDRSTSQPWTPRLNRRWGWMNGDWLIEWRRPEPSCPRGYYLFGPNTCGLYLGTGPKEQVTSEAQAIVDAHAEAAKT